MGLLPSMNAAFLIASIVLFVLCSSFFCECIAALFPPKPVPKYRGPRPRLAVLVPALNEEATIRTTLNTLTTQLGDGDRLIVIADNCTDNTAAVARSVESVTVIERENRQLRGKGYALDYGLGFLAAEPPEIVVTVDSDCHAAAGTIDVLARWAAVLQRPVQSTYLMQGAEVPQMADRISTLALCIKNRVRLQGLARLRLPCVLTGSGIAYPWSVISQISLASDKTVDDMQLAVDLSILGHPPVFCPQAHVTGRLMAGQAAKSQRSRWEHGHIDVILREVPRLLRAAWQQRRPDLLGLALDVSVPPLSLLTLTWLAVSIVASLLVQAGGSGLPLLILGLAGALLTAGVMTAWVRFASEEFPLSALLGIPFYIVRKIPIYLAFLIKPQTRWTRTERG